MKAIFRKLVWSALTITLCAACSSSSRATNNERDDEGTTSRTIVLCSNTISVSNFNSIDNKGVGNLKIVQTSGDYYMKIGGDRRLVQGTMTKVSEGKLYIWQELRDKHAKGSLWIEIGMPSLQSINLQGVGGVSINGLDQGKLTVETSGVGNVSITRLKCTDLVVDCRGVGNVTLSGSAVNVTLNSRGVGNIDSFGLEAKNVSASSQGVGNIECTATDKIDAKSSGVGKVKFKGHPKDKQFSASGLGHVVEI